MDLTNSDDKAVRSQKIGSPACSATCCGGPAGASRVGQDGQGGWVAFDFEKLD